MHVWLTVIPLILVLSIPALKVSKNVICFVELVLFCSCLDVQLSADSIT